MEEHVQDVFVLVVGATQRENAVDAVLVESVFEPAVLQRDFVFSFPHDGGCQQLLLNLVEKGMQVGRVKCFPLQFDRFRRFCRFGRLCLCLCLRLRLRFCLHRRWCGFDRDKHL